MEHSCYQCGAVVEEDKGNKVELKVGTEDNQHIVAVQPAEKGKGSTFALVYVQTRGKDTI